MLTTKSFQSPENSQLTHPISRNKNWQIKSETWYAIPVTTSVMYGTGAENHGQKLNIIEHNIITKDNVFAHYPTKYRFKKKKVSNPFSSVIPHSY